MLPTFSQAKFELGVRTCSADNIMDSEYAKFLRSEFEYPLSKLNRERGGVEQQQPLINIFDSDSDTLLIENRELEKVNKSTFAAPNRDFSGSPLIPSPSSVYASAENNSKHSFLNRRRDCILEEAVTILENSKNITPDNYESFEFRVERLKKLQDMFDQIQSEILETGASKEDIINYQRKFSAISDEAQSLFFKAKKGLNNACSAKFNSSAAASRAHLKLPKIELPRFNGKNLSDWSVFQGLFEATIHNSTVLSNSEKFQYLLAQLDDEPLR